MPGERSRRRPPGERTGQGPGRTWVPRIVLLRSTPVPGPGLRAARGLRATVHRPRGGILPSRRESFLASEALTREVLTREALTREARAGEARAGDTRAGDTGTSEAWAGHTRTSEAWHDVRARHAPRPAWDGRNSWRDRRRGEPW